MKEREIGDIYKEKFANYQQTPPTHLWESIQKDSSLQKFNHKHQIRRFSIYAGITLSVLTVVILTAIHFFAPSNADNKSEQSDIQQVITKTTPSQPTAAPASKQTEIVDAELNHASPAVSSEINYTHRSVNHNDPSTLSSIVSLNSEKNNIPASEPLDNKSLSFNEKPAIVPNKDSQPSLPISKDNQTSQDQVSHLVSTDTISYSESLISSDKSLSDNGFPTSPDSIVRTKVGMLHYSKDTSVCRNAEVVLYVENAGKVRWSTGIVSPYITVYPEEFTIFYADITTLEGKDTMIYIRVDVFDCKLFVPTAFTPNGDGLNDEFIVHAPMGITNYECIIFDPASRILFKTNSVMEGWDGTTDGKKLPHGAYFYVITYRDPLGEKHVDKGQIVLIR